MKRFWAFTAVFNSSTHRIFRASFFPAENQPKQLKVGAYPALTPLFLMKNCRFWLRAYIGKDVETFIRQFGNPKEKLKQVVRMNYGRSV